MRQRAHHLAKELGVSLKDLVRLADEQLNFQINSHAVLLHESQVQQLRALFDDDSDG